MVIGRVKKHPKRAMLDKLFMLGGLIGYTRQLDARLDSDEAGKRLAKEAAAVDFVRDAFGHLKAIAACGGTRKHILSAAGIKPDKGVVEPDDVAGFIALAKTRQWAREPKLRTLA